MDTPTQQSAATTAVGQTREQAVRESVPLASFHDARWKRVLDYQARSLEKDDPLEATLGSVNSGLMRTALWLDEATEKVMDSGPPDVERLAQIAPAIDTYLRVARQVDRFANIELRAAESRQPKRPAGNRIPHDTSVPPVVDGGQSEESEV